MLVVNGMHQLLTFTIPRMDLPPQATWLLERSGALDTVRTADADTLRRGKGSGSIWADHTTRSGRSGRLSGDRTHTAACARDVPLTVSATSMLPRVAFE